jgi:hypothetical protein
LVRNLDGSYSNEYKKLQEEILVWYKKVMMILLLYI